MVLFSRVLLCIPFIGAVLSSSETEPVTTILGIGNLCNDDEYLKCHQKVVKMTDLCDVNDRPCECNHIAIIQNECIMFCEGNYDHNIHDMLTLACLNTKLDNKVYANTTAPEPTNTPSFDVVDEDADDCFQNVDPVEREFILEDSDHGSDTTSKTNEGMKSVIIDEDNNEEDEDDPLGKSINLHGPARSDLGETPTNSSDFATVSPSFTSKYTDGNSTLKINITLEEDTSSSTGIGSTTILVMFSVIMAAAIAVITAA